MRRLQESLAEFGQVEPVCIGPANELYNGHQRLKSWAAKYGDIEIDVRVSSRALTEKEREKLTVFLHKGAAGEWDFDALANEFELDELMDWGFTEKDFGFALPSTSDEPEDESEPELERLDVPDAVWPTDNDWGVPLLDANLQARAVDLPFVAWGTGKYPRKSRMPGTWHFYTEDYRFEALWSDPSPVVNTRCVNAVEPNFSCYDQMARAFALFQIYRKRWLARYWQSQGLRVLVDLNVAVPFYDLNLLGVPKGWGAWATRGYSDRIDNTAQEYQMAVDHAGTTSILFVVYGGGKKVKEACQSNGWLWFDEETNNKIGGKHGKG